MTYDDYRFDKLVTGKKHLFRRGMIFAIDIFVDPKDAETQDDKYQLLNEDGSVHQTRTVADDAKSGDEKLTLFFTGLENGSRYSLEIDQGGEGKYYLFYKVLLDDLVDLGKDPDLYEDESSSLDSLDDVKEFGQDVENDEVFPEFSEDDLFA